MPAHSKELNTLFRVVIDPGHGGTDEGAIHYQRNHRILEKDITLRLAHQIARQLQLRGFLVHLTRVGDQEISLPDRTAMANRLGADVFLSIHVNSAGNRAVPDAEGIETFFLNSTTDGSSRRLARIENSVISAQLENSINQPDVALILKDLTLDGNVIESKRLACHIQTQLVKATSPPQTLRRRNRGIKQALFHVLLGADMPAILLETGFLNHPYDRALMLSPKGQLKISRAVTDALDRFRSYKKSKRDRLTLSQCRIK